MDISEKGATRKTALFGATLEQSKKGLKLIKAEYDTRLLDFVFYLSLGVTAPRVMPDAYEH